MCLSFELSGVTLKRWCPWALLPLMMFFSSLCVTACLLGQIVGQLYGGRPRLLLLLGQLGVQAGEVKVRVLASSIFSTSFLVRN